MMTKQELIKRECNGFVYAYTEDGAYFFQKCLDTRTQNRFAVVRCLPEDMTNGNFEFQALHGLTNTNKA